MASGFTRRTVAGALLSTGAVSGAVGALAGPAPAPMLRRGMNLYHVMQSATRTKGPDQAPIYPPFASPIHDMPDAQIAALASAGFDFVRLTLAPDVFMRATGADADALYALLQTNVRRFIGHGLNVVVVLMPGNFVHGYTNADIAANTQGVFDALCAVAGRCAVALRNIAPGHVVMEPLNEPGLYGLHELQWGGMQQRLHQVVRMAAPNMPVLLTGAESGGLAGLLKLDPGPYRGSNVLYSFHYYEPHIFTHQHVSDAFKYLSGVTWPPRPQDLPAVAARMQGTIAADRTLSPAARMQALAKTQGLLTAYYASGQGPQTVTSDFARVAGWADEHGVDRRRILLGEFGVTRTIGDYAGAPDRDAMTWLKTVRSAAERSGFPWAMWSFSGPVTMTLANEYPAQTFDPGVLQALGMRVVQP